MCEIFTSNENMSILIYFSIFDDNSLEVYTNLFQMNSLGIHFGSMRYMHTFKSSALFALAECMRVSQEMKTGRFWASVSILSSLFWDKYVQHKCWQFVQGMYKSVPIEVFSDAQKSPRRLAVELYAHVQTPLPCSQLQSVRVLQEIKTCQLWASFSIFDGNSFWGNLMISTLSTKLDYNVMEMQK